MCHAFTRQLSIALNKSSKPAYSSKNYLCVKFPQHRDANVHIAAILFFDMLKGGCKSAHNISKAGLGTWQRYRWRRQDQVLLVEGVHHKALESLRAAGYTNIEFHKGALDDEQSKESTAMPTSSACDPVPI
ncbi:hypothetical protein ACNKHT_18715 [Shigella flexneri]